MSSLHDAGTQMTVGRAVSCVLATATIILAATIAAPPASAEEMTLALCDADNTTARVYREGKALLMRVYSRQQDVVWINGTPIGLDMTDKGLEYRTIWGEQTVRVAVNANAEDCAIQIGDRPAEAGTLLSNETTASVVVGTVAYRSRIRLPRGAVVEVKLQDVSRTDAPAITVAEQIIVTDGEQVPIPFSLFYDSREIDPSHAYSVQARILVNDELRWINTSLYPVITDDHPSIVEMIVESIEN